MKTQREKDFEQKYREALFTVADHWGLPVESVTEALVDMDKELDASIVRIYGEDALLPATIYKRRIPVTVYEELDRSYALFGDIPESILKWVEGVPYRVTIQAND